jgi:quinol monooxygenase YgiN
VKADRSRNQLEDYKAAVREHIETAIRVEPGVLVLYAVSEKDPTHIRVFEIYARTEAYRASRRRAPEAAARRLDVPRGRPACGPSSLIFVISEFTLGTVNLPYFTVRQNRTTPGGSFPEVVQIQPETLAHHLDRLRGSSIFPELSALTRSMT